MPPTLQALRVPEVIGTVKVNIDGGSHSVVVDPRTGYVYAFKSGAINILKGKELVGRIGTSNDLPESVALDEVGGYLYVVRNRNRDTVMVIQGTEIIGTVTLTGQQLASVAIEPETHLAYVVGADLRTNLRDNPVAEGIVTIMNRTQIIQSINVGRIPLDQIVADPVGGYMYAGNASGIGIGTVIVFKGSKEVARNKISSDLMCNFE
jgi:DNA-binding beta-propeller fold protein YncE